MRSVILEKGETPRSLIAVDSQTDFMLVGFSWDVTDVLLHFPGSPGMTANNTLVPRSARQATERQHFRAKQRFVLSVCVIKSLHM